MNQKLFLLAVTLTTTASLSAGYLLGSGKKPNMEIGMESASQDQSGTPEQEVLYWYDPMYPQRHFAEPGPSPFMDMPLVPRYAGEETSEGVSVNARLTQNLGMRLALAREVSFQNDIRATGTLAYNRRLQTELQLRRAGFVEETWPLADGDLITADQPLLRALIPDWSNASAELLTAHQLQDGTLIEAARERMRLLGMPEAERERIEDEQRIPETFLFSAPIAGVLERYTVRPGMNLSVGDSIARINGIGSLWLDVAVPERHLGQINTGDTAEVRLASASLPVIQASVEQILPNIDPVTRTMTVRLLVPNPNNLLRPGASASVRLQAGTQSRGIAIPTEALIRNGHRSWVMLADADSSFQPVEVVPGPEYGDETLVLQGLQAGQQVVRSGQFLLDSEATLLGIGDRFEEQTMRMDMNNQMESSPADGGNTRDTDHMAHEIMTGAGSGEPENEEEAE